MVEQICAFVHNYFEDEYFFGDVVVSNGTLVGFSDRLKEGQYYRIKGSALNDGVYKYGTDELLDEEFSGCVISMNVPRAFADLAEEIEGWVSKYGDVMENPYTSESFGGYSYSKKTAGESNTDAASWQGVFRSRLNEWRKIS